MPTTMGLTQEQQSHFAAWLNQHWKATACSICGTKHNWSITPFIWEFRPFGQGSLTLGGPIFPVLVITCEECGNLVLFSAIKVGVVKADEPKRETATPAPALAKAEGEGGQ